VIRNYHGFGGHISPQCNSYTTSVTARVRNKLAIPKYAPAPKICQLQNKIGLLNCLVIPNKYQTLLEGLHENFHPNSVIS